MLVNLAVQSTTAYLDFLVANQLGFDICQATWDQQEPAQRYVNQEFCFCYRFVVHGECRIPAGSAAEFLPGTGEVIPVTVVERGTHPTTLVLAFKGEHGFVGGQVRSDLKWLVQRVLDWLTNQGHLVNQANLPTGIPEVGALQNLQGLSDEQKEAIASALRNRLSYTWGPPGSGKTTYVLSTWPEFFGRKIEES